MILRVAGSVLASLVLWLSAIAGVTSAAPRIRSSFEVDAPSAVVGRTISFERATIAIGAPTLGRGATHPRWASGALADAARATTSPARVRGVLLERARAHVPRTLRRTYDAHAPPTAIDRV